MVLVAGGTPLEVRPHAGERRVGVGSRELEVDVLAERRGTTRGALYKTLHDARRKLRAHLADAGLGPDEWAGREGT